MHVVILTQKLFMWFSIYLASLFASEAKLCLIYFEGYLTS